MESGRGPLIKLVTDYRRIRKSFDREIRLIETKKSALIRTAIGFPSKYEVGMSNLGWQVIYRELNSRDDTLCERFFFTDNSKPATVEQGAGLQEFHLIGFSISYELDFVNVLKIIAMAGLQLESSKRRPDFPLIMAGGPGVTLNPQPLADFIDFFIIGDGEVVIQHVADVLRQGLESGWKRKKILLKLSELEGIYVPEIHPFSVKIKKNTLAKLDNPASSIVISPDSEFGLAFLIEINRGCSWGCRFCASSYANRPCRTVPLERIIPEIKTAGKLGVKVGLVGTSVSSYPWIKELAETFKRLNVKCSVSSLRIDKLESDIINMLANAGQRQITIAPETADASLKQLIAKEISEDDILKCINLSVNAGIINAKLYFLIGLPGAGLSEAAAIVDLVKRILGYYRGLSREKGRMGTITVGINPFVPKASTPMQWMPMARPESLKEKISYITGNLRRESNLNLKFESVKTATLHGLMSRGNRELGHLLARHVKNGEPLHSLISEKQEEDYLYRDRKKDEVFPWDNIDLGVGKKLLWQEKEKADKIVKRNYEK